MLEKNPESNQIYSMPVPIARTEPPSSTLLTLLELYFYPKVPRLRRTLQLLYWPDWPLVFFYNPEIYRRWPYLKGNKIWLLFIPVRLSEVNPFLHPPLLEPYLCSKVPRLRRTFQPLHWPGWPLVFFYHSGMYVRWTYFKRNKIWLIVMPVPIVGAGPFWTGSICTYV